MPTPLHFDVIVVGAGIVGLAHALEAAERGLSVAVVDRDARCVGASIRNFGFVTVTGQPAGDTWRRARHAREVWARVAPQAGIDVVHRGLWVQAHRREAQAVLEQFAATEMGEGCSLHTPADAAQRIPALRTEGACAALYSPHELRVESRTALPLLARWLASAHGVQFYFAQAVLSVEPVGQDVQVDTPEHRLRAERVVICTGADVTGIARPALRAHLDVLKHCSLNMLRVRSPTGFQLGAAVMADLSLVRYLGYAVLPAAAALRQVLERDAAESLRHGIHLIVVQSADGSLVVGDSHHYTDVLGGAPDPFALEAVDTLILGHLRDTLRLDQVDVLERWTGVYPTHPSQPALIESPAPNVRAVVVTSGTGASTAFGLAHDVFSTW